MNELNNDKYPLLYELINTPCKKDEEKTMLSTDFKRLPWNPMLSKEGRIVMSSIEKVIKNYFVLKEKISKEKSIDEIRTRIENRINTVIDLLNISDEIDLYFIILAMCEWSYSKNPEIQNCDFRSYIKRVIKLIYHVLVNDFELDNYSRTMLIDKDSKTISFDTQCDNCKSTINIYKTYRGVMKRTIFETAIQKYYNDKCSMCGQNRSLNLKHIRLSSKGEYNYMIKIENGTILLFLGRYEICGVDCIDVIKKLFSVQPPIEYDGCINDSMKYDSKLLFEIHTRHIMNNSKQNDNLLKDNAGDRKLEKNTNINTSAETEKIKNKKLNILYNPIDKEKTNEFVVSFTDFVVKSSTGRCKWHPISSVNAEFICMNQNGDLFKKYIHVYYCQSCEKIYMLKRDYDAYLKNNIKLLCRCIDEEENKTTGTSIFTNFSAESVLHQYGYNVNQNENLSTKQRQTILSILIDNSVLRKDDILSHLDMLITINRRKKNFEDALSKWETDRRFVISYKKEKDVQAKYERIVFI